MSTKMRALSTRRLLLTPLRSDDLRELRHHWAEPEVRRYLWDGRLVSLDEVREVIDTSARLFEQHGAGLWRIGRVGTPHFIGCGGFWHFHEPPELELVLSLSRDRWGRGFAQEAAAALLDYVFNELRWTLVQASADPPNSASLKLMSRLGMRPSGERPGKFGPIEVYRIAAADWLGNPLDAGGSARRDVP